MTIRYTDSTKDEDIIAGVLKKMNDGNLRRSAHAAHVAGWRARQKEADCRLNEQDEKRIAGLIKRRFRREFGKVPHHGLNWRSCRMGSRSGIDATVHWYCSGVVHWGQRTLSFVFFPESMDDVASEARKVAGVFGMMMRAWPKDDGEAKIVQMHSVKP